MPLRFGYMVMSVAFVPATVNVIKRHLSDFKDTLEAIVSNLQR